MIGAENLRLLNNFRQLQSLLLSCPEEEVMARNILVTIFGILQPILLEAGISSIGKLSLFDFQKTLFQRDTKEAFRRCRYLFEAARKATIFRVKMEVAALTKFAGSLDKVSSFSQPNSAPVSADQQVFVGDDVDILKMAEAH